VDLVDDVDGDGDVNLVGESGRFRDKWPL